MTLEISRIGVVMAILAIMVAILMGSGSRRERKPQRPVHARPEAREEAMKRAADRFAQMKQARQEANYQTYKQHGGAQ